MDDTDIAIVLHTLEGVGFQGAKIMLTASLGGKTLQAESIQASNMCIFDKNIIWETNRKSIKRMKTVNLPIKIECYSTSNDSNELIGFIIVPIRTIAMTYGEKMQKTNPRWHKLLGLSTAWKTFKPELLMCVIITPIANINKAIVVREPQASKSDITTNMLETQQGIFVKLIENDESKYIQVGDSEDDCHRFIVKSVIRNLSNLKSILEIPPHMNPVLYIQYSLFGNPPVKRNLIAQFPDGSLVVQERITIHLQSSIQSLREYFSKIFAIPIDIFCHNTQIGNAEINLTKAMPPVDNISEFVEKYQNHNFTATTTNKSLIYVPTDHMGTDRKISEAYFNFDFSMKYCFPDAANNAGDNGNINVNGNGNGNVIIGDVGLADELSCGEMSERYDEQIIENKKDYSRNEDELAQESQISLCKREYSAMRQPESYSTTPASTKSNDCSISYTDSVRQKQLPRTFCYKLLLQKVQWNKKPVIGIWQISLHHPKAHTPLSLVNVELKQLGTDNFIIIANVEIMLYFSSGPECIQELIESEPCVLNIKGPRSAFATAELDNTILLAQKPNIGIILMENEAGEKAAMAHAHIQLEDIGTNFNSQQKKFIRPLSTAKPYLDEELAYKAVEELENWKRQQEVAFMAELKQRTIKHLASLTKEWQKEKAESERTLTQKLEQCNLLTNALEEGHKALKDSIVEEVSRQRNFVETKAELEKTYSSKIMAIQERVRCIEEDCEKQLKLSELKYKDLQSLHSNLKIENEKLKECIKDMEQASIEKNAHDDIIQDLKQSNEELRKSKQFYKEQWAKSVREINRRKLLASQESKQDLSCSGEE